MFSITRWVTISQTRNVPVRSCSLRRPLLYHSPAVFLDHGHPHFGNFNSIIPVDVIRVKSYADSFLDATGVPVRVLINKLYLAPKEDNGRSRWRAQKRQRSGYGRVIYPFVFFDSLLHGSPCFLDVDFAALTGNPV